MKNPANKHLIGSIVDGMYDWVRVLDLDDNVLFMNKPMSDAFNNKGIGMKCYQALGKDKPCENCTTRALLNDEVPHTKEEIIGGKSYSVMCSPIKNKDGKIEAVVEVLRDITGLKKMTAKIIEQNRELQAELELARKIQTSLLPSEYNDENIKFLYHYRPSKIVGGDFLGFFKIDDKHAAVFIADVQGHGVPASLMTVFLHSSLNKTTLSPSKALSELHKKYLQSGLDPHLYMTIFYSIIDLTTLEMKFANAGHSVSPIVFGPDRFKMLHAPGIPISNWLEDPNYTDREFQLQKGDRIIYLTDGLVEMRNKENKQYGVERLIGLLQHNSENGSDILSIIGKSLETFTTPSGEEALGDDLTIAVLEIKDGSNS